MISSSLNFFIAIHFVFSSCAGEYVSLRQLTRPEVYNRSERPPNGNAIGQNIPVAVSMSLRILSIDLQKQNDEFVFLIKVDVEQKWHDSRLVFSEKSNQDYLFTMNDDIWVPNLAFLCERGNAGYPLTWSARINPNGTVNSFTRLLNFATPIERGGKVNGFHLKIISMNYAEQDLKLLWDEDDPIKLNRFTRWENLFTDELTMSDIKYDTCNSHGIARISRDPYSKGNYSCLYLKVSRETETSSFLLIYLPSSVFVMLTWISFWMEKSNVLGRCLPPVLALAHQMNQKISIMRSSLLVPDAVVLSIWVHVCEGFALAAILQVVVVTYLYAFSMVHYRRRPSLDAPTILMTGDKEDDEKSIGEPDGKDASTHHSQRKTFRRYFPSFSRESAADDLNAISRWLFPVAFVLLLIGFCVLHF